MKKVIIITAIAILALVILMKSGILDALVVFLLAGEIPGTKFAVPSTFMLLGIVSIIWLLIFRLAAIEALHSISLKRSAKRQVERKKRLPKRRFGQI